MVRGLALESHHFAALRGALGRSIGDDLSLSLGVIDDRIDDLFHIIHAPASDPAPLAFAFPSLMRAIGVLWVLQNIGGLLPSRAIVKFEPSLITHSSCVEGGAGLDSHRQPRTDPEASSHNWANISCSTITREFTDRDGRTSRVKLDATPWEGAPVAPAPVYAESKQV